MTRLGLTQAADMAATIRNDLALEGASECVLNALRVLENKLRPVPGKRTGRPRSATTPSNMEPFSPIPNPTPPLPSEGRSCPLPNS